MSEFERRKDQIQEGVQSGAALVGRVAVIITDAIGAIAREVGDFVSDGIEMQEAARAAKRDQSVTSGESVGDGALPEPDCGPEGHSDAR
ncbi:hypothetical protein [Dietzia sp. 179-F 9C3 NHS]|uniref:hypothetical protein n=1 Tax=Dietzia sp. 179-F 9C3 NHS TaxID=3374295 RepID=UPI003879B54F